MAFWLPKAGAKLAGEMSCFLNYSNIDFNSNTDANMKLEYYHPPPLSSILLSYTGKIKSIDYEGGSTVITTFSEMHEKEEHKYSFSWEVQQGKFFIGEEVRVTHYSGGGIEILSLKNDKPC